MFIKDLLQQIFLRKKIVSYMAKVGIPALVFYGLALIGFAMAGYTAGDVLRDPSQDTGRSSLLGSISTLGIWFWICSATICVFSALNSYFEPGDKRRELLLLCGLLATLLAVDDRFMIHDRYVSQNICFLLYALCAGSLLLRHYKSILAIDGFSFLLAGFLLALSISMDLIPPGTLPLEYRNMAEITEKLLKFTGGATWLYFCCRIASYRELELNQEKVADGEGA